MEGEKYPSADLLINSTLYSGGKGLQLRSKHMHFEISSDGEETLETLLEANSGMSIEELFGKKILWFVGHKPFLKPFLHHDRLLRDLVKMLSLK